MKSKGGEEKASMRFLDAQRDCVDEEHRAESAMRAVQMSEIEEWKQASTRIP